MLDTITIIFLALSRTPEAPVNVADTYSASTTNDNLFQNDTKLIATANAHKTLYQSLTVPNIGLPAILLSSSSVLIANPRKFYPAITKKVFCTFCCNELIWKNF